MGIEITFGGHSFVALGINGKTIFIDPWTDNPNCPDSLKSIKPDLIVLTHGHFDHAGNAVTTANHHKAKVVGIVELIHVLKKDGLIPDLAVELNKGGVVKVDDIEICLTHAIHTSSYLLNGELVYAGEACGVVVKFGETSVYHAGDTALFADMDWVNYRFSPKVAFLPIGDVYTMGVEDAVEAAQIIQAEITIPIHHSTFPILTGKPEDFAEICKTEEVSTQVKVLQPGEKFTV
ncbi:MAG: metal-dependent hydrolase [Deltaproteobacteria bacterium]|nr:metal-dependent hydrolase [Deltaproteobacteria bacterium]